MLTRCAAVEFSSYSTCRISLLKVTPFTDDLVKLASIFEIAKYQSARTSDTKSEFHRFRISDYEVRVNDTDQIYIPAKGTKLQLQFFVTVFGSFSGYSNAAATKQIIREENTWSTMDDDVDSLIQECLVCLLFLAKHKVWRSLRQQKHAKTIARLLSLTFCSLGNLAQATTTSWF